jgi:hypothetical protein
MVGEVSQVVGGGGDGGRTRCVLGRCTVGDGQTGVGGGLRLFLAVIVRVGIVLGYWW